MWYILLELLDLIPLRIYSFECQYEGEKLHWRIGGLLLLLPAVGVWFVEDFIGFPYCLLISIISCILLVVHLTARAALIRQNNDSLD